MNKYFYQARLLYQDRLGTNILGKAALKKRCAVFLRTALIAIADWSNDLSNRTTGAKPQPSNQYI